METLRFGGFSYLLTAVRKFIHHSLQGCRWRGAVGLLLLGSALSGSAQPAPYVTLKDVPTEVMIGGTFTFTVLFDNSGATEGYGPYIEVHLQTGGADLNANAGACTPGCDGLSLIGVSGFVDTSYSSLGFNQGVFDSAAAYPCPFQQSVVPHPFAASGVPSPLTLCPGYGVTIIKLNPGVVYPSEPAFEVQVTVKVSEFADRNFPLQIAVRGGFQLGADALDNPSTDPPVISVQSSENPCYIPPNSGGSPFYGYSTATVSPTVFTITKTYFGPENETATGPNNLHYYGLVVDVAAGQTIKNLKIQDFFPDNMVFQNAIPILVWPNPVSTGISPTFFTGNTSPHFGVADGYSGASPLTGGLCPGADYEITAFPTPVGQAAASGANLLEISLCHDVVGGSGAELAVVLAFFIPERNAAGDLILDPQICAIAHSTNNVRLVGDWLPADCRDQIPPNSLNTIQIVSDVTTDDHILDDKCLAIQKSWLEAPVPRLPGSSAAGLITYVLDFQVSDYRTLDTIEIVDFLSDGQKLVPGTATMEVSDQFGATPATGTVPFIPGSIVEAANQTAICQGGTRFSAGSATRFAFNVSMVMASQNLNPRHGAGILTGGLGTSTASPVPARGRITYQARVQDQFDHFQGSPPGDLFVDKSDFLDNCVTIHGSVLNNEDPPTIPASHNGCIAEDMSKVGVPIDGTKLSKSIYAIERLGQFLPAALLVPPVLLAPGDKVTFRLQMPLPSGDGENLIIRDWLPEPVFRLADPNANGGTPWVASAPLTTFLGTPPSGSATAGPNDLFVGGGSPLGPVTVNAHYPGAFPAENTLEFWYGTFNDQNNLLHPIDILFTITVTSEPFADGYPVRNVATECEDNTFDNDTNSCTSATFDMKMGEPKLKLTKGVVAVDELASPNAVFSPALGAPAFTSPNVGGCPRFSGVVNAANLNSDVSGLVPGTIVTFAIVVENLGIGPLGAFDIKILDTLPPCFLDLGNMCVTTGNGAPIATTADLFLGGLVLSDPGTGTGAIGPFGGAPGANVAVITFDAIYEPGSGELCCTNLAELKQYSNIEGGVNFVTAADKPGLLAQIADKARACGECLPVFACAPDKTVTCSTPWGFNEPTLVTGCCGTNFLVSIVSTVTGGTACLQTFTRTWAVQDDCGHSTTCIQKVTVEDITPPLISRCAADQILTADIHCMAVIPDLRAQILASDNCGPVTITQNPMLTAVGVGTHPVVFTVCDGCLHCVTCTIYVTVIPNGPDKWAWAHSAGIGGEPAVGNAVAVDGNGNVFVTGNKWGGLNFVGTGVTLYGGGIFLAKYNAAGALLWARSAGSTGADEGNGVTVDEDGNAYVTGVFRDTAPFDADTAHDLVSQGLGDVFIAKYDPSGNVLWTHREGGSGDDYGTGIAWTPVFAGGTHGSLFITGAWGSQPTAQAFVLRLRNLNTPAPTVSGPVFSQPGSGSGQFAQGRAVAVDILGNPYITGFYGGSVPTTFPGTPAGTLPAMSAGLRRIFVAKFAGNNPASCTWQTHGGYAGASAYSDGTGIAVDPPGVFCYVTAYFTGTASFGPGGLVTSAKNAPNGQLNDYLVARLRTSDGTPMWAIAGGGNPDSNDETRGLTVDRNGNPSVTGFLHPFSPPSSGTPFVNSGPTVLAAGYDASSGIARWIHNANDGLAAPNQPKHAGNGIALNLQGCVHIAGEFTEDLEFLPATTLNASAPGQSDMFVAKMCSQCCPGTPVLNYTVVGTSLQLTWEGVCCHLESTGELSGTPVWIFLGNTSPITVPMTGPQKFFRLVCP